MRRKQAAMIRKARAQKYYYQSLKYASQADELNLKYAFMGFKGIKDIANADISDSHRARWMLKMIGAALVSAAVGIHLVLQNTNHALVAQSPEFGSDLGMQQTYAATAITASVIMLAVGYLSSYLAYNAGREDISIVEFIKNKIFRNKNKLIEEAKEMVENGDPKAKEVIAAGTNSDGSLDKKGLAAYIERKLSKYL